MSFQVYGCYILKAQLVALIWSVIQAKYKPFDGEVMNTIILTGFLISTPLILTLYVIDFINTYYPQKWVINWT